MNLFSLFNSYLTLQALLILGCTILFLLSFATKMKAEQLHKLNKLFILLLIFAPLGQNFLPGKNLFEPMVKVWSAPSKRALSSKVSQSSITATTSNPENLSSHQFYESLLESLFVGALALMLFGFLFKIYFSLKVLENLRRRSYKFKQFARVQVLISNELNVPISYWRPGLFAVLIPEKLVSSPQSFKISIAHELQHHRQSDTRLIYISELLKFLSPLNPFLYFWNHQFNKIQEFAVDEALLSQKRVTSPAYARCLIEVAQSTLPSFKIPACATGLLWEEKQNTIHRRIKKMYQQNSSQGRKGFILAALTLTGLLGFAAYAAKGLVQDRRIDRTQALTMLKNAQHPSPTGETSDFPLVINDRVLFELNRFLGTPDGREQVRQAFARMPLYQDMILKKINSTGAPIELLGLVFAESGFANLPQPRRHRSAGLWQFIPETARRYGMKVEPYLDERLHPEKATDGALAYLLANKATFSNWQLAVMAYNAGENRIRQGLSDLNTQDPWVLAKNGYEGDTNYLARVIAAILILKNPDSAL